MTYCGPNPARMSGQVGGIQQHAGESVTWRHYVSAATQTSAYFAGGGLTPYYSESTITALMRAPQMGEARFRETPLPAGMIMAGDMVVSTFAPLGSRDELIWRGVTYRIEGDATPVHIGGRLWYNTLVRRGDVTG